MDVQVDHLESCGFMNGPVVRKLCEGRERDDP